MHEPEQDIMHVHVHEKVLILFRYSSEILGPPVYFCSLVEG